MENKDRLRHPESGLPEIVQPLGAFGSGRGNCKIPGQGYFQAVHSQEKETFWHQNLQTVTNQAIRMT